MSEMAPALSVVIPTFNNVQVLAQNIESWQQMAAGQPVELIVVEDGCRDSTAEYLDGVAVSEWGRRHLRWHHQDDQHELRCTNFGLREARAPLAMAWQDDMFLRAPWLVPEIIATFAAYPDSSASCVSAAAWIVFHSTSRFANGRTSSTDAGCAARLVRARSTGFAFRKWTS